MEDLLLQARCVGGLESLEGRREGPLRDRGGHPGSLVRCGGPADQGGIREWSRVRLPGRSRIRNRAPIRHDWLPGTYPISTLSPVKRGRLMTHSPSPGSQNPPPERSGTVLETDEDIRQALLAGLKDQQRNVPIEPKFDQPPTSSTSRPASPYR